MTYFDINHIHTDKSIYNECPHREKYSFNPRSTLRQYFESCEGCAIDPEHKYTINYIILILLTNLKKNNWLIQNAVYKADFYIVCNKELQLALRTPEPFIKLRNLRRQVLRHMEYHEKPCYANNLLERYYIPFWCVGPLEPMVSRLFENYDLYRNLLVSEVCELKIMKNEN